MGYGYDGGGVLIILVLIILFALFGGGFGFGGRREGYGDGCDRFHIQFVANGTVTSVAVKRGLSPRRS